MIVAREGKIHMRFTLVILAGTLVLPTVAHSQAQPNCNGINLEALKNYLEQSQNYLTRITATEWKAPDGRPIKLSDLVQAEITNQTRTSLALVEGCAKVIAASLNAIVTPRPPPPPPVPFTIKSATFGDHLLQRQCQNALVSRKRRGPLPECDFTCNAMEAVRVACAKPIEGTIWVEKGTRTKVDPASVKSGVAPNAKDIEVLGNGIMCSITVGYELCFNVDPSPDSPQKALELTYTCKDDPKPHTVDAGQGATIIVGCTKP